MGLYNNFNMHFVIVFCFYFLSTKNSFVFRPRDKRIWNNILSTTSGKKNIEFMCEKAKNSIAFLNLEGHVKGTAVLTRKGILRYKFEVFVKACR